MLLFVVTFILKKVILVKRSTVDLRSCSLSGLLAGKLFCKYIQKHKVNRYLTTGSKMRKIQISSDIYSQALDSNTENRCQYETFMNCKRITVE